MSGPGLSAVVKPPKEVFPYTEIYNQTVRNKGVNRAFLDGTDKVSPLGVAPVASPL